MMDIGLDTIIYLVLGAIFVLAQLNRKRKPAKPPQVPEEKAEMSPESQPTRVSDLWNEFWNSEEKEPVEVVEPLSEAVYTDISPTLSSLTNSNEIKESVKMVEFDEHDLTRIDQSKVYGDSSMGDHEVRESFDLRSAVIYSAILDRKYV